MKAERTYRILFKNARTRVLTKRIAMPWWIDRRWV